MPIMSSDIALEVIDIGTLRLTCMGYACVPSLLFLAIIESKIEQTGFRYSNWA